MEVIEPLGLSVTKATEALDVCGDVPLIFADTGQIGKDS